MNTINGQLKAISEELNLNFEHQDWGIINSSAIRVDEFIDFYNTRSLNNPMRYQLLELIIASFNDALLEKKSNAEVELKFCSLFQRKTNDEVMNTILNYWQSLDGDEFPIVEFLGNIK